MFRSNTNKVLSLLLAVIMVFGGLPVTAWANEQADDAYSYHHDERGYHLDDYHSDYSDSESSSTLSSPSDLIEESDNTIENGVEFFKYGFYALSAIFLAKKRHKIIQ